MDTSRLDPASHIRPEFTESFTSWHQLHAWITARATDPAYDQYRAAQTLIATDLAHRITADTRPGWILRGSLSLPARADTEHLAAPFRATSTAGVAPIYAHARQIGDIDLCATNTTSAAALEQIVADIATTPSQTRHGHGYGLGGIIHYSTQDLRTIASDGRVVAEITATPIDPRRSTRHPVAVGDPIPVHIDLSPAGAALFDGPAEPAKRSTFALDIPGFADYRPDLYPTENQVADKLVLANGPRDNRQPPPNWHRYKDLADLQYLTAATSMDGDRLRSAVADNPNLGKGGRQALTEPYRLYGLDPAPGEATVPWAQRYEQMRADQPAMAAYPPFGEARQHVEAFADNLPAAGGRTWEPGAGWTVDRSAVDRAVDAADTATQKLRSRTTEQIEDDRQAAAERHRSAEHHRSIDPDSRHLDR